MPSISLSHGAIRVERFVVAIVLGGLALVSGLWLLELFEMATTRWGFGLATSLLGVVLLGVGIGSEVEFG